MYRVDLREMDMDVLLRLRQSAREHLQHVPAHLYPLLNASLHRRIAAINEELASRHEPENPLVKALLEYTGTESLDDAIRVLGMMDVAR